MDYLFQNVTVITMDPACPVMEHAYLGVSGDKIVWLSTEAPEELAAHVIYGAGKVLIPGLQNTHTHIAMTALRGYADDQTLTEWLFNNILPAEAKMNGELVYHAARLGILEALSTGTTSICDMYFHSPEIARAARELGIRAHVGNPPFELGDTFNMEDRSVSETEQLIRDYANDPLITPTIGVHAIHNSNAAVWKWVNEMAEQHHLPVVLHLSETMPDVESSLNKYGKTPTVALRDSGMLRFPVTAAHCVHLTDEDIAIMKEYGLSVASCPVSNLKLASGIAPLCKLKEAGVNITLATDGVASNNNFDLFEEMKLSVLLQKNLTGDASALSAWDALTFATVNGNIAMGRGDRCGKLLPGYEADIVMLDFTAPHLNPCHNVVSHVVYAAHGSDVELTMVRGQLLYENRAFIGIDLEEEITRVNELVAKYLA